MRSGLWLAALCGQLISAAVCAGVVLETRTKAFSEPVPIPQMLDGWTESGVGEVAQAKQRNAIGWRFERGYLKEVGIEKRVDYHLAFSKDTARFYSLLEHQGLEAGDYPLRLDVNGLEGKAVYFEGFIPLSIFAFTVRTNVIKGERMQYGSLDGIGSVLDDGRYSFEYDLDYRFAKNVLLDQSAKGASGWGYSFDLEMTRPIYSGLFTLGVNDFLYTVHWRELGRSDGCLFRERVQLTHCDQNFVQDSTGEFTQRLPAEWYGQYRRASYSVDWQLWDEEHYLMLSKEFKSRYRIGYELMHNSIEAAYKLGQAQEVTLGLDHYDVSKARVWTLNLRYAWL